MFVNNFLFFFFFQAEDGIRDYKVTGVQTCALPIYESARTSCTSKRALGSALAASAASATRSADMSQPITVEIGRASCREREKMSGVAGCWQTITKRERWAGQ